MSLELYSQIRPKRSLLFVDGDQTYENVRSELEAIIHAAPLAIVLYHDIGTGEGKEAFDAFVERHGSNYEVEILPFLANIQAGMGRLWPQGAA